MRKLPFLLDAPTTNHTILCHTQPKRHAINCYWYCYIPAHNQFAQLYIFCAWQQPVQQFQYSNFHSLCMCTHPVWEWLRWLLWPPQWCPAYLSNPCIWLKLTLSCHKVVWHLLPHLVVVTSDLQHKQKPSPLCSQLQIYSSTYIMKNGCSHYNE